MNTFALDKNYSQLNFEEISVDDLEIISGGTGSANVNDGLSAGYYSTNLNPYHFRDPINSTVTVFSNPQRYSYTYTSSSGTSVSGSGSVYA